MGYVRITHDEKKKTLRSTIKFIAGQPLDNSSKQFVFNFGSIESSLCAFVVYIRLVFLSGRRFYFLRMFRI